MARKSKVYYKGFLHHYRDTKCFKCQSQCNMFYVLQTKDQEIYVCQDCISKYKINIKPLRELIANAFDDRVI